MTTCRWCQGHDDDNPETLCRPHLAEYEGLSLAELDRMMESELFLDSLAWD